MFRSASTIFEIAGGREAVPFTASNDFKGLPFELEEALNSSRAR
jgi:hypothetical protein